MIDDKFRAVEDSSNLGYLEMELQEAKFLINDGQHRCAAIAGALNENPALGKEQISVLLFPFEGLERAQQMFSDLNRFVQPPPGHSMSSMTTATPCPR
jgi:DNA sulfur modification protein DndB